MLTTTATKRLAVFTLFFFVSGCSAWFLGGYGNSGRSRDEFAEYVESVFKFQNQMTSKVMMLTAGADDLSDYEEIFIAEQRMQEQCEPLNEYAALEADGGNIGFFLRRRVEKTAEICDRAAHRVENLLKLMSRQPNTP
ncbi:MAG: hypothetical protein ACU84J_07660 [Gammaproteobacteria bacterium]